VRDAWRHFFHRGVGTLLGWGLFGGGCVLWGILVIPITLMLRPFWRGADAAFRAVTRAWLRTYSRSLLFARFTIEGSRDDVPRPSVIVANHQSYLDPILLLGLEPRLGGPAQRYLFRAPFLRTILRMSGFYPADQSGSLERAHHAVEAARRTDGSVLFFPEGTRSRDGRVGEFHRGAFRVAYDLGVPIQPVVIEGLDRVLPPHSIVAQLPRRERVRIRYLPALHPPYGDGPRREVVRRLCAQTRDAMIDELTKMRGGGPGR
jgi:1-acyl-sn-glycerol-3-phosphate acyltransferase